MRELIKTGAYSFTDGSRVITITDGRSFTAHDIIAIFNQTQKVVLVSELQKSNITDVTGSVITYDNSLPALVTGDELSIYIDFTQSSLQAPEYSANVHFTNESVSFKIPKSGILVSFGNATNLKIKQSGSTYWSDIVVPYNVSDSDLLYAECSAGCDELIRIQFSSVSGNEISPGTLGSKILNGCNRFALYSETIGKFIIGGLGTFDEDMKMIAGDGNTFAEAGTYVSYKKWNQNAIEHNGYLYFASSERGYVVRIKMNTGELQQVYIVSTAINISRFIQCGNYIYFYAVGNMRAIDTTDLSVVTARVAGSTQDIPTSVISDGTNVYVATRGSNLLYKVNGISLTELAIAGTDSMMAEYGDYVYNCYTQNVRKIAKSTFTVEANITTNINTTLMDCIAYNGYLYSIFGTGQVTKIDLATFVSPSLTVATGVACNSAVMIIYNGHLYILLGDTNKFIDYNLSDDTYVVNTLSNTHNSMNLDSVNGRLAFFTVTKTTGTTLYPVEIVTI